METQEMSYTVTAVSNIGPVKYSITTTIAGVDVPAVLADGVLYNAQRKAASKAVKALGGGKRENIPFSKDACDEVEFALREVFGASAEINCEEYVKQAKADVKFVRAHAILDAIEISGGDVEKLATKVKFADLEIVDGYAVRSEAFLRAITDYKP